MITVIFTFLAFWITGPENNLQAGPDTLKIASSGVQNHVIINSKKISQFNGYIDSLAAKGEIVQRGENNRVEIQMPNSKPQITNKFHKSNCKNQTGNKPVTRNHITITQTGKNNSVKINSR